MKFMSLLIPVYLPRAYPSATPAPYQSSTVDSFERELSKLSGFLVRHGNTTRLSPDVQGRFVHQQIVVRYDLMIDPTEKTMGDAIVLALKSFGVGSIAVIFADKEVSEITILEALEIQAMLHPWCEIKEANCAAKPAEEPNGQA